MNLSFDEKNKEKKIKGRLANQNTKKLSYRFTHSATTLPGKKAFNQTYN